MRTSQVLSVSGVCFGNRLVSSTAPYSYAKASLPFLQHKNFSLRSSPLQFSTPSTCYLQKGSKNRSLQFHPFLSSLWETRTTTLTTPTHTGRHLSSTSHYTKEENKYNEKGDKKSSPSFHLQTTLCDDTSKQLLLLVSSVVGVFGLQLLWLNEEIESQELLKAHDIKEEAQEETQEKAEEVPKSPSQTSFTFIELLEAWWPVLIPELPGIFVSVLFAFANSAVSLLIPRQIGLFMDYLQKTEAGSLFTVPLLRLFSLGLVQAGLQFAFYYLLALAVENATARLRKELFKNLLRQDIAFYDQNNTAEVVHQLSADVQEVKNSLKHIVSMGVRNLTSIIGGTVSLWQLSPKLTTIMLVIVPTMVLIGTLYTSFLRTYSKQIQAQNARSTAITEEVLSSMRTVRAFANEGQEAVRYAKQLDILSSLSRPYVFCLSLFQGLSNLAINSIVITIFWYGSKMIENGELSSGQLTSFLIYSMGLQGSFINLASLIGEMTRGFSSGARLTETLRQKPFVDITGGVIPSSVKGAIEFSNINFRYPARPDTPVLRDFKLKVQPGQVIALVGKSGAGKSTIVGLLERFYDPTSGVILLDEKPIVTLDPSWLRRQIGIVSQEPVLFSASIKENICYGKPDATEQELKEACRIANCDQFISQLPAGYETQVGERGTQLSGGQKQRVAIARAVLKNPRILILDEATSALDGESERLVKDALDKLMKGRTVFVIAHRLSTIQNADKIVVLKKGAIVETGTHHELVAKHGFYASLIANQQML